MLYGCASENYSESQNTNIPFAASPLLCHSQEGNEVCIDKETLRNMQHLKNEVVFKIPFLTDGKPTIHKKADTFQQYLESIRAHSDGKLQISEPQKRWFVVKEDLEKQKFQVGPLTFAFAHSLEDKKQVKKGTVEASFGSVSVIAEAKFVDPRRVSSYANIQDAITDTKKVLKVKAKIPKALSESNLPYAEIRFRPDGTIGVAAGQSIRSKTIETTEYVFNESKIWEKGRSMIKVGSVRARLFDFSGCQPVQVSK